MTQFDKPAFEKHMGQSVQLQRNGQYEEALRANMQAYDLAPDNSTEKGRAARDSAARLDQLGRSDEAELWALEGYNTHNHLLLDMAENSNREAYRERAASAMVVGVIGMRRAIHARRVGEVVEEDIAFVDYFRSTLEDLEEAKTRAEGVNQIVDQYQINATRRVSMSESLFGDRKRGVVLGLQAVALACMSESPKMDTADPNLTLKERLLIKNKATLGGIAALGVAILAAPRSKRRQNLALKIADKTI